MRYNDVTLLRRTNERHKQTTMFYWECLCHRCGKEFKSVKPPVVRGKTKSCKACAYCRGCPRNHAKDLTGQTVNGFLHIVGEHPDRTDKKLRIWEAVCMYENCGTLLLVSSELIRKGKESCGCKQRADTRKRALARYLTLTESGNEDVEPENREGGS